MLNSKDRYTYKYINCHNEFFFWFLQIQKILSRRENDSEECPIENLQKITEKKVEKNLDLVKEKKSNLKKKKFKKRKNFKKKN